MNCKHFQFYDETYGRCLHIGLGDWNEYTFLAMATIPFGVALSSATSFGPPAFQIFFLMLLFNYGKKDSSSLNQAMQAGLQLTNTIKNLKKKTQDDQPLVNINLAILLIPIMLTGTLAGLHYKDYIPTLFHQILFIGQILVLIFFTSKKAKQMKSIQSIHKQTKDNIHEEFIQVGDGIMFDFESFFDQAMSSPNKDYYIKMLPKELLDEDLTIDEHKVRVKDFLNQNQYVAQQMHKKLTKNKLPYEQMAFIGLTLFFNFSLFLRDGPSLNVCHSNYWSKLPTQIILNFTIFIVAIVYTRYFKIVALIKLFLISLIQGFLLGLIGNGASFVFVILLSSIKDVPLSKAQISATIPLIQFASLGMNTIISIATGLIYDIKGMMIIFFLSFFGQMKILPKVTEYIKPAKSIRFAMIFQIILLGIYIILQVPKILNTPFIEQISPRVVCQ